MWVNTLLLAPSSVNRGVNRQGSREYEMELFMWFGKSFKSWTQQQVCLIEAEKEGVVKNSEQLPRWVGGLASQAQNLCREKIYILFQILFHYSL